MNYETFSSVLADIIIKRNIESELDAAVIFDKNDLYNLSCECLGNANAFERYKKKLYICYERRRDQLKADLKMDIEKDSLDCHKVAAVILYAILDLKPIKFTLKNVKNVAAIPDEIKLLNYRIAFKSACGIIYTDMLKQLEEDNHLKERDELLKNGGIFMPKVRDGLASYLDNYAKVLYCNDKANEKFTDFLEVADTMFLIELLNYKHLLPNFLSVV